MDGLSLWFQRNLDIVFLIYGLAFVLMGTAVFSQPKKDSIYQFGRILWLLAVFGITHGVHELLDMLTLIKGSMPRLDLIKSLFLITSFSFLFEFGRQLSWMSRYRHDLPSRGFMDYSLALCKSPLLGGAFTGLCLLTLLLFGAEVSNTVTRYILAFPGGLFTAFGFYAYYQYEGEKLKSLGVGPYFILGGAAFLLYAFFGGLVASQSTHFPFNYLNDRLFLSTAKLPVEVFRALCAACAALAVVNILKIFNTETEKKIETQHRRLEELNRTLERRVEEEVAKNIEKDRLMVKQEHLANLGVLAASIIHEINAPLTYIKGYLELLRAETGAQQESKSIAAIETGLYRIEATVEAMKNIGGHSRKERVTSNVFSTVVDACKIVFPRAKHIAALYLNERPFTVEMGRDEETFTAPVVAQSVSQVWIVILNNALDEFLKETVPFDKRRIEISLSGTDGKVLVAIEDNAGGIPENIKEKIFDPFVSTKPQSGIGIGLHIAKKIIEDHSGEMRAYNSDSGAVFEVALPASCITTGNSHMNPAPVYKSP